MGLRVVSWNIKRLAEPWRLLATDGSIDVALLQEATPPPAGVACDLEPTRDTAALVRALETVGRRARVEQELQDLLSEPLVTASIDLLHLAIDERAPSAWTRLVDLLERLDPSLVGGDRAPNHLARHVEELRTAILGDASPTAVIAQIVCLLGEERLRALEPRKVGTSSSSSSPATRQAHSLTTHLPPPRPSCR